MLLSVLDLSPVPAGSTSARALANTLDLAEHVEGLGFHRYWLAEHHNAAGLACPSPEVLIAAIAARTKTLRVGSGGIMLPNHAPLRVAEAFRVLSALHPSRIDLGIGRAAGTDKKTALALRRHPSLVGNEAFGSQLDELTVLLTTDPDPDEPFNATKAIPTRVAPPEVWLLGASVGAANEAGARGLRFAYAHHFNPAEAPAAFDAYRASFRPSRFASEPRTIVATAIVCGESDEHAKDLASSGALWFLWAGRGLRDRPLPSVAEAREYPYDDDDRSLLQSTGRGGIVGGPERVHAQCMDLLAATKADELMVTTMLHDHEERRRSYERLAALVA
jgi:luciferase family oxidoreductase group 1